MTRNIFQGLLKVVIGLVVIVLGLCVLFQLLVQLWLFSMRYPKQSDETDEWFKAYRYDFNLINNYIIENFDYMANSEDNSLMLIKEDGYVTALYDNAENILISDELKAAFRNIDEAFENREYSFITITDERISYEGLGNRMFVYSRNGKIPDYFYYDGDGIDNYSRHILPDNWYLLIHHVR